MNARVNTAFDGRLSIEIFRNQAFPGKAHKPVDRLHFLAHNPVIESTGASHRYRAVTKSSSPIAGGAVSQCINSFEPFLMAVSGACPLRAIFACLGKPPLRLEFSRATIKGFAYETWVKIKLSTGGVYFIHSPCG